MSDLVCKILVVALLGGLASQASHAETQTDKQELPPPPPGLDGSAMPPPPPGGFGQGNMPPPPRAKAYTLRGTVTVGRGQLLGEQGHRYSASAEDTSALYIKDGGQATLTQAGIETHGATSSDENSSFFGLNAAVLATAGSSAILDQSHIVTTGSGANGAFATGKGAHIVMHGGSIRASGGGAHGIMTSFGGQMELDHVDMQTSGAHAAPVATDRGGGRVTVTGGHFESSGEGSPGIYSTGEILVRSADFHATGAEGAVIEGQNSIELKDTRLHGGRLAGVMIYQSFSGDASGHNGQFRMQGGALIADQGPLFFVTNAAADISLEGVQTQVQSGILVRAGAARWGRSGQNGGQARLKVVHQVLRGDLVAEQGSSIALKLEAGSRLSGRLENVSLRIDADSHWNVTADSLLKAFQDEEDLSSGSLLHVIGNGHTVRYDAHDPANADLKGRRYRLSGGGELIPG